MSATHDSTVADPQQVIAELKRDLARRTAERDAALARETATAEVLGVINSSAGDLAPVFDAMLEKATRLCEAPFGLMSTYDGQRFQQAASYSVPTPLAEFYASDPPQPGPETGLGRIASGAELVHITDLADPGEIGAGDPRRQRLVALGGVRSYVVVALRRDGRLLGTIAAYRQEVRPFTDRQIALLQNFAAQAVIAMENARLLAETREALKQQTATAEVLGVINSSPGDLAPVFDNILEHATRICAAEYAMMALHNGDGFHGAAVRGVPPAMAEHLSRIARPRPGTGLYIVEQEARSYQTLDAAAEPAYDYVRAGVPEFAAIRTMLHVPMVREGRLVGVIVVYRLEVRAFGPKEVALLENFAAQAVIAVENARLLTETREALEQQTATAEVLGVINSSPGDLAPVFDAMLEKAMRLCEAAYGNLFRYDGNNFEVLAASHGEGHQAQFRVAPGGALSALVDGEDVVSVEDLPVSETYRAGSDHFRELVERRGYRSGLHVSLRKEGKLFGAFVIFRQEVRPFTDKQIALLQNFAAQAVIAMENARLLGELRQRTEEVAELNRGLEARVAEQVEELGRVGRLKRFLAPQLAEMIVSQGDEKILESHRREIVVVFCDVRGYTAFTETAEPEEVLDFLREYHGALGPLVSQFEGTLDQFSGDGIMVFFNDPVPVPDPAERAVKMAVAMREAAGKLIASWRRRRGRMLGFGVGIAQGYATLGQIGFAERSGYTAIGTVCNLAARLCAEAKDGQILLAQRVAVAVEETTPVEEVGELTLKGLTQPVVAYDVPLVAAQPALRVIEGGPPLA